MCRWAKFEKYDPCENNINKDERGEEGGRGKGEGEEVREGRRLT